MENYFAKAKSLNKNLLSGSEETQSSSDGLHMINYIADKFSHDMESICSSIIKLDF